MVCVHHLDWVLDLILVVCTHHYSETSVAHDPERLVYTVPEAGRLLGLGRNAAYEAAKRGDIPTLRMGRRLLVPKIPFHRMLEMTGPSSAAASGSELFAHEFPEAAVEKGRQ
jgi:excisionase family DNA binding protein